MTKRLVRISASFLVCVLAGACAQPRPTYESSWQKLLTHFAGCSSVHGYDPRNLQELPENRLGDGELEWRACAYQGVDEIMVPASSVPEMFRELIREDKTMTAKIAKGEMMRSERKARVMAVLADIHRKERQPKAEEQRLRNLRDEFRDIERSRNRIAHRAVRGFF